ncbi:MAG TPA: hypothetical protein VGH23_16710 [Rhizomicrobium sp.]|jgi:hypothetical protein
MKLKRATEFGSASAVCERLGIQGFGQPLRPRSAPENAGRSEAFDEMSNERDTQ